MRFPHETIYGKTNTILLLSGDLKYNKTAFYYFKCKVWRCCKQWFYHGRRFGLNVFCDFAKHCRMRGDPGSPHWESVSASSQCWARLKSGRGCTMTLALCSLSSWSSWMTTMLSYQTSRNHLTRPLTTSGMPKTWTGPRQPGSGTMRYSGRCPETWSLYRQCDVPPRACTK